MNHIGLVTLKSLAAKQELLAAKKFEVKGKRCLVLDPNLFEVKMKVCWVLFHVHNDSLPIALQRYGKVKEIIRKTWKGE